MSDPVLKSVSRLANIAPEAWDAIANPHDAEYDPFLSWNFLDALETSGSASEETGWAPRHLIVEDEAGQIRAGMPLYVKTHSQGEYVFDHAWADAYERAGGQYYPKLLTAVPFTPATGRRLLSPEPEWQRALLAGAVQAAQQWQISSWHINFPDHTQMLDLDAAGLLVRRDRQFIWQNRGYRDYADFLDALSSRKRKALKRERAEAQAGIEIEALSGTDLTEHHWDVFFQCYQETGSRKWGYPYLNREFFHLIHERMPQDVLLVMARKDGRYFAAALNFLGSHALYGRYWGRLDDHPCLHFELCYHQAIDHAIARSLDRVEAGAQGEHKLARGYEPTPVHSAHWIGDPGFRDAVDDYLVRERSALDADIAALAAETPFKKSG